MGTQMRFFVEEIIRLENVQNELKSGKRSLLDTIDIEKGLNHYA
jgi:hypothetical protein